MMYDRKGKTVTIIVLIIVLSILCAGCNFKKRSQNDGAVSKTLPPEEAIGENVEEPAPWNSNNN